MENHTCRTARNETRGAHKRGGGGCQAAAFPPPNGYLKTDFIDTVI